MAIQELLARRSALQQIERDAKKERGAVEKVIRETPEFAESVTGKPYGKREFFGASFTVSEKREWDQAALTALAAVIDPAVFPFKIEFKEDRRASAKLADESPELWAEIKKALTVKSGSPSFGE